MIGALLRFSRRERLHCSSYGENLFEIFQNDFKTFQYVQKYTLRRALGEASLREDKFMKQQTLYGNSIAKILKDLTNSSNDEHPSGAPAFIIPFPFGVRCLVSLRIQEMLIL